MITFDNLLKLFKKANVVAVEDRRGDVHRLEIIKGKTKLREFTEITPEGTIYSTFKNAYGAYEEYEISKEDNNKFETEAPFTVIVPAMDLYSGELETAYPLKLEFEVATKIPVDTYK